MKNIRLENFILEEFNEESKDYFNIVRKFDMDEQINKYIIATEDSFSDIVHYYNLQEQLKFFYLFSSSLKLPTYIFSYNSSAKPFCSLLKNI